MAQGKASKALGVLIAAFHKETIGDQTAAVYVQFLADINPPLLEATVLDLIRTETFFPAIATIRRRALELAGLTPLGPAEALAIVRKADVATPIYRRDGSYAYTERTWEWPEEVNDLTLRSIRKTLARVGDPTGKDGEALFGWDTGFQKAYSAVAEEVVAEQAQRLPVAEPKGLPVVGAGVKALKA